MEPEYPAFVARCSVESSSELKCRTPEVVLHESVFDTLLAQQPNPVELHVHLGEGSDMLDNLSSNFIIPDFKLRQNPTINEWDPEIQPFKIYDGQEIIRITVRLLDEEPR